MSNIKITPAPLNGTVSMPPSKSAAHRAILCAALADGISVLRPIALSNDISATIACVKALGTTVTLDGDTLTIDGRTTFNQKKAELDCGESGSTLRFMIPVAAVGSVNARFIGHGRLPQRPIGIYLDCLPNAGVVCRTEGGLPLEISGTLQGGTFEIPGNVSSQFITGLLLALPLADTDSTVVLTSPLESSSYVDMTVDIMKAFGVNVAATQNGWKIKGNQRYIPQNYAVEGDWSQAAFFLAAAAMGGSITIDNLNPDSKQGDKACAELFARFGSKISWNGNKITATQDTLHGIEINAENIPDLVPILACTAAVCDGKTVITGAARLRIKESDRLAAITEGLSALGADITELPDGLVINGRPQLHGGNVNGFNDHRIVMALAVTAIKATEPVTVSDKESINKSYPDFFEDYIKLGGNAHVIMG